MGFNDWRERAENTWQDRSTRKSAKYYEGEPEVLPAKPDPVFDHAVRECEKAWKADKEAGTVMWMLRLCVSHQGNIDKEIDHTVIYAEKVAWLRSKVGELLRMADAAEVLGEPRVRELVMTHFGEAGIARLIERTKPQQVAA